MKGITESSKNIQGARRGRCLPHVPIVTNANYNLHFKIVSVGIYSVTN